MCALGSAYVSITLSILMLVCDIGFGFAQTWLALKQHNSQPFSFAAWSLQWTSVITTAIGLFRVRESTWRTVSLCILLIAGWTLAYMSAHFGEYTSAHTSTYTRLGFSVVMDVLPSVCIGLDQVIVFKSALILFATFDEKANWGNDGDQPWTPGWTSLTNAVWVFFGAQSMLLYWSLSRYDAREGFAGNITLTCENNYLNLLKLQCSSTNSMVLVDTGTSCTILLLFVLSLESTSSRLEAIHLLEGQILALPSSRRTCCSWR